MQIRRGSDRVVFLFPVLGIAVKFPVFHFVTAWQLLFGGFKKYGWELMGNAADVLFRGLADNWMEFWFYIRTRNPLLQPTYFSLCGFVTIQRYGQPCSFRDADLWHQLKKLTEEQVQEDGHHFSNSHNFTFDQGVLRIFDYGSCRTRKVIANHGVKISNQFDPAYNRNKEQGKIRVCYEN